MDQSLLLEAADLQNWNGVIVDVRPPPRYRQGHIDGSVNLPLASIRQEHAPAIYVLEPDAFAERVGALGIDEHTPVAIYGERGQPEAGYLLWALKYYGLNDVRLLNGGLESWVGEDFPLTQEISLSEPKPFSPTTNEDHRALGNWVFENLNNDDIKILDSRSEAEYQGQQMFAQRGGHIPGAVHLDWYELLDDDLKFKSEAELRTLFEQLGLKSDHTAVVHCQSGNRAGAVYAALKLIGHENVRLYDGSWGEWGNHPDTPIE